MVWLVSEYIDLDIGGSRRHVADDDWQHAFAHCFAAPMIGAFLPAMFKAQARSSYLVDPAHIARLDEATLAYVRRPPTCLSKSVQRAFA